MNSRIVAVLAVAAMALALGACGRKSGLDLPPSASTAPAGSTSGPTAAVTDPTAKGSEAAQQNLFNAGNTSDRTQYAPRMPPKRILIDPILD